MSSKLALLALLAACTHDPGGGASGGDDDGGGDDDPAGFPELSLCFSPSQCAAGLTCAALDASSYCLRPCPGDPSCGPGFGCDASGYCLRAAVHYAPCGRFDACGDDALCAKVTPAAEARCVPICAVGDLTGKTAVASCPALPAELDAAAPSCRAGALPGSTASFCVTDVAVGERCDELLLRCNPEEQRADSDATSEPATSGGADPGAPRCLPRGTGTVCARVCSVDDEATVSPCACPGGDSLCQDPSAGLAWDCVRWSELQGGLAACAPIEACTDGSACADNARLTTCAPSPYSDVSGSICQ